MTDLATQELSLDVQFADNALQDALKQYAQLHNVEVDTFVYNINYAIDEALLATAEVQDNYKQPALVQSAEIMCVSIDDFINRANDDEDDETGYKEDVKNAYTLTPIEWRMMGEVMADWMYDGDKYDNALDDALKTVIARREK